MTHFIVAEPNLDNFARRGAGNAILPPRDFHTVGLYLDPSARPVFFLNPTDERDGGYWLLPTGPFCRELKKLGLPRIGEGANYGSYARVANLDAGVAEAERLFALVSA